MTAKQVDLQQTGMSAASTAGFLSQICTNGVLDASILAGPAGACDALKSDITVTVNGTTADGTAVVGFPISGGQWDPTAWKTITAITGAGANVWAGWYLGRIKP